MLLIFPITDAGQIIDSTFDISVLDSNSLVFLFKHAPGIASELEIGPDFSLETADLSSRERWMVVILLIFTDILFARENFLILNLYKLYNIMNLVSHWKFVGCFILLIDWSCDHWSLLLEIGIY